VKTSREVAAALRRSVQPLVGAPRDFDPILAAVGDAHVVLIGEASHGTHEFYRIRAELTKRLIRERGFAAVAVEADWPDAYRVNRYVQSAGTDRDASGALADFKRFPQWMWRNADVLDFVGWLREHNETRADAVEKVGFYGLDLYSLHASIEAVIRYLRVVDPEAARRARERYACFDHFGGDVTSYARTAGLGVTESCEREVVGQLLELRRSAAEYARRDGRVAGEPSIAVDLAQQHDGQDPEEQQHGSSKARGFVPPLEPGHQVGEPDVEKAGGGNRQHVGHRALHPVEPVPGEERARDRGARRDGVPAQCPRRAEPPVQQDREVTELLRQLVSHHGERRRHAE
jgi:hypothetical protein